MGININKSIVSKAIISKIKQERNPRQIRAAHVEKYQKPESVVQGNKKKEEIVPDITAIYDNEKILYEIELDKELPVKKWSTLSEYARKFNGSFYLVIPKPLRDNVKKALTENELNIGIISFDIK